MNLSTEQRAILSVLAANDDLGHDMDDFLGTGLSEICIKQALRGLIVLGLVQRFVVITEDGIALLNSEEVA